MREYGGWRWFVLGGCAEANFVLAPSFCPLALSLLPWGMGCKQELRLTIFDCTCSFVTRGL
jgi:hypothetical protein